jgi:acetyl-CoA carboxylase biotin carboxylase subunit
MIGKIIATGRDRKSALDRLSRALDETLVRGIRTTIPLGQLILRDVEFRRGKYSTAFVQNLMDQRAQILPTYEQK